MKESLSLYVKSNISWGVNESIELEHYLNDLLNMYRDNEIVTEGAVSDYFSKFGQKIKSTITGKNKKESEKKATGLFGGLLSCFGCTPSKYEQAMQEMYEENAKRAAQRAKDLENSLEDVRIAKMKSKNAARQSMLDQTNRAKINELKLIKDKYDREAKKWNDLSKGSHKYTEEEIQFVEQSLESLSTVLPTSEQKLADKMKETILRAAIDPNTGEVLSEDTIKKNIKEFVKDNKELDEFYERNMDLIKSQGKEITDVVNEITGNTEAIRNSESTLEQAQKNLSDLTGTLSDNEKKTVKTYRDAKIDKIKAVLESGDDLNDNQKEFLSTLSVEEAKKLGGGEVPVSFKQSENGLSVSFDPDKLKDLKDKMINDRNERITKDLEAKLKSAVKKASESETNETDANDVVKYCEENGIDVSKLPDLGIGTYADGKLTVKTDTAVTNIVLNDDLKSADFDKKQKDKAKAIIDKPLPENPTDTINSEAVNKYVEIQHNGVDKTAIENAKKEVEKAETLVALKKDMPNRTRQMLSDYDSQNLNRKLNDELTIKTKINGKEEEMTMKEYKEKISLNPGEFVDDKGKIYTIDSKNNIVYKPKDPTSKEYKEYQNQRSTYLLNHQNYPSTDDDLIVANKDGKVILKDKDGNITLEKSYDDLTDDEKQQVAQAMVSQSNRETYKETRKDAVNNIKSQLKQLVDGKIDLKNKKPEDMTETELFLSSLTDENGELDDEKFDKFVDDIEDEDLRSELSEYENVEDTENDEDETEDEDTETGDEDNTDSTKKPTNPKRIWKRRRNKTTGKLTKSYYYAGSDPERKSNNESIPKDEYIKRIKTYKEKLSHWKETHPKESSLQKYILNSINENKTSNFQLKDFITKSITKE